MELQELGTMTVALPALSDWLAAARITHVGMESTSEYWKPLYNLLEGDFTVFLVNATHVKQVLGRRTDKADARWLAKLMRHGMLQASSTPPLEQCDLRDLTRYRTKLVQERSREVNRVQGVLERANIKRAAVAADIMRVSAWGITLLDTIPGVNQRGGELLVVEWGIAMGRFGTAARLAAWSGIGPGNDESAGKKRRGKIRRGN
jgi:transposase